MKQLNKFYINGNWVAPVSDNKSDSKIDIINPATEQSIGQVTLGSSVDVDRAVSAATEAFKTWSLTSREERLSLLDKIIALYQERLEEMAEAISTEMGAPMDMALNSQAAIGLAHLQTSRKALESFSFEESQGNTHIFKEPIGVCGFITPWNWPMNQIACKVAPAIACGCTMILKPSEYAPLSANVFSQILHDAGVPAGVYNMVYGDGPNVGATITSHPDIEMISLTGSTRAGIAVSKAAADTIKRVALELGGKSANIILEDADIGSAVSEGAASCFSNTGQSCNAPTRMLVPAKYHNLAVQAAVNVANNKQLGDPNLKTTDIGPLSNKAQFTKVQSMIQQAIDEGTELAAGGVGRPSGLTNGYFTKPTVFANVSNDMMIAREEVFGPVLSIIPYNDEEHAIEIANDTLYGLAGYIQSGDHEKAKQIAKRIRAGTIYLNNPGFDPCAPFGGYKQSGNGREWGHFAFDDFLEIKGVVGYDL
ncbi:MAG: aldehyde dehydrogenase family protein [Gammaproteobacteria bacterium]|nr:aldehyde dehydrogenase family protein [Gammaproteobacteria bacterium]